MKAQTNNYNDNEATCYNNKDNDNNYKSTTTAAAAAPELDPNFSLKGSNSKSGAGGTQNPAPAKLKIAGRHLCQNVKYDERIKLYTWVEVDGGRIFRNLAGKASVAVKNLQLRFSVAGEPMRWLFGGLASFEGGDQNPIGGDGNRHRK
ncbi:hypothetical protein GBA52_025033 [Prunus armeniaca]|nr:hypothetical protein GBA52_025033 [Prunus armeniaca]